MNFDHTDLQSDQDQAEVAQLVEQLTRNEQVGGSSPLFGSSLSQCIYTFIAVIWNFWGLMK
jgi:hypothetical protein